MWFVLGNIGLFWLIGLQYVITIMPLIVPGDLFVTKILAWFLLISGFIGQLSLLALLPMLFIALPLVLCCYRFKKCVMSITVILYTLAATALLIDAFTFKQFHFHLNGILLELMTHRAAQQIFDFTLSEYLTFIMGFISLLTLESCYAIYVWRKLSLQVKGRTAFKYKCYTLACLVFSYCLFIFSGVYPSLGLNKEMLALPLYENVLSYLLPRNLDTRHLSTLGQTNFIQLEYPHKKLQYPLHALNCQPPSKPLNIVIIAIDAWRFDMVDPNVTPHIAQFAKSNLAFTQHFSGGNGTRPGIFSLFYGLPASYWTSTITHKKGPVFIDELLRQQYQTGIFASASLEMPAFNLNVFQAIKHLQLYAPGNSPAARDQKLTAQFKDFIKTTPQPFFSFLFYDSAHSYCRPHFLIPTHFKPIVEPCNRITYPPIQNVNGYFNRYKNALYFIDQLIADVLTTLKQQGLWDNTVVIITGDHGQEFNDNNSGRFEHANDFGRYQTQTPLLIHWPGKTAKTISTLTTHYDVAPTLMSQVLGCKNPANDYSIGQSLFSTHAVENFLIYSYTNFAIVGAKQITTIFPTGNYEIKDKNDRVLPNAQLNLDAVQQAFNLTNQFTKQP